MPSRLKIYCPLNNTIVFWYQDQEGFRLNIGASELRLTLMFCAVTDT